MMGRLHWVGTCFAMHGQTSTASQTDEIMSKYRPIAPKPTFHMTSNSCKSTSNPNSALDFRLKFTTTHNNANNGDVRRHNVSGRRRRASYCSQSFSPRVLKRARGTPKISPIDERSTHNVVGTSITVDGPKLVCPFDGSFSADKSSTKGLEVMEIAAAYSFKERSVVDKSFAGFEGLNVKAMMKSIGEVDVESPATNMEVASVPRLAETKACCGSAKRFVFPIVSDIQQEKQKHLVTLPLLPETPFLQKDFHVFGSTASNSTCPDHKPIIPDASCDKEEITLRLFGRDFSHKKVGACQLGSSNESPKPKSFVPIVGLSFI